MFFKGTVSLENNTEKYKDPIFVKVFLAKKKKNGFLFLNQRRAWAQ